MPLLSVEQRNETAIRFRDGGYRSPFKRCCCVATAVSVRRSGELWFGRAFASVGVFEPDDVVEFRGRHFEHVNVGHCHHSVNGVG